MKSTLLLVALFGAICGFRIEDGSYYFNRMAAQDSADIVVQKFLARMTRSIESKDTAIISGLFQPGFIFKGCRGVYNKQQIVGLLSQIPSGTKFTFSLKSVLDNGVSIRYTVSATGFAASAIEAEFVLNKVDQQLESGVVPACQKSHFLGVVGQKSGFQQTEDSAVIINDFLKAVEPVIVSRDRATIERLFDETFLYYGCHGTYHRKQIARKLSSLPYYTRVNFEVISSKWKTPEQIEFIVNITGKDLKDLQSQFVFDVSKGVLISGGSPVCPKKRFMDFY